MSELAHHEGVRDQRVLDAFAAVPRHLFVPVDERHLAYEDRALPLSEGQTISQPSMIALMLEVLSCEPRHRVLEVGAGSGYAAALLGQLAAEVIAIERLHLLAEQARRTLAALGYSNISVIEGDGTLGCAEGAPFDRILVSAAAAHVPRALTDQLTPEGRIVVPVTIGSLEVLRIGQRQQGTLRWRDSVGCHFVPLVGS